MVDKCDLDELMHLRLLFVDGGRSIGSFYDRWHGFWEKVNVCPVETLAEHCRIFRKQREGGRGISGR